jgi:hypothetical protein
MGHSLPQPVTLRLVHEHRGPDAPPLRRADKGSAHRSISSARRAEVGAENRAATTLTPDDARMITAQLAADAIEGGRAAIIRPEVRRRLVATAIGMGLRPFDANLVIAIVQDDARTGLGSSGLASRVRASISREASGRIAMVRPGNAARPGTRIPLRVLMGAGAMALGVMIAVAFARWITGT